MEISQETYKTLRTECTQGEFKQNEVFSRYGIEIDHKNLVDYTRYLVNLTVANIKTQAAVFSILHLIPVTQSNNKFLLMLINNILADQPLLIASFLNNNLHLFHLIVESLLKDSEELFEWSYYIVTKIHPGNFYFFYKNLENEDFVKFLNFLASNCEKNWKKGENVWPDMLKIEDLHCFSHIFDSFEEEILVLGNYVSRDLQYQEVVADIFMQTGFLEKCYNVLGNEVSEGMRGAVLQILSNTLFDCTVGLMNQNVKILLKSAELDVKQPTCREWVFVIIRKGVSLSAEFKDSLQKLYDEAITHA